MSKHIKWPYTFDDMHNPRYVIIRVRRALDQNTLGFLAYRILPEYNSSRAVTNYTFQYSYSYLRDDDEADFNCGFIDSPMLFSAIPEYLRAYAKFRYVMGDETPEVLTEQSMLRCMNSAAKRKATPPEDISPSTPVFAEVYYLTPDKNPIDVLYNELALRQKTLELKSEINTKLLMQGFYDIADMIIKMNQ